MERILIGTVGALYLAGMAGDIPVQFRHRSAAAPIAPVIGPEPIVGTYVNAFDVEPDGTVAMAANGRETIYEKSGRMSPPDRLREAGEPVPDARFVAALNAFVWIDETNDRLVVNDPTQPGDHRFIRTADRPTLLAADGKTGVLYVYAAGRGVIEALDGRSGDRRTSVRGYHRIRALEVAGDGSRLVAVQERPNRLVSLDAATLAVVHEAPLASPPLSIVVDSSAIVIGTRARTLQFFDAASLAPGRSVELPTPPTGLAFDGDRLVVSLGASSSVIALNLTDDRPAGDWIALAGPERLRVNGDTIYVLCRAHGQLIALPAGIDSNAKRGNLPSS